MVTVASVAAAVPPVVVSTPAMDPVACAAPNVLLCCGDGALGVHCRSCHHDCGGDDVPCGHGYDCSGEGGVPPCRCCGYGDGCVPGCGGCVVVATVFRPVATAAVVTAFLSDAVVATATMAAALAVLVFTAVVIPGWAALVDGATSTLTSFEARSIATPRIAPPHTRRRGPGRGCWCLRGHNHCPYPHHSGLGRGCEVQCRLYLGPVCCIAIPHFVLFRFSLFYVSPLLSCPFVFVLFPVVRFSTQVVCSACCIKAQDGRVPPRYITSYCPDPCFFFFALLRRQIYVIYSKNCSPQHF